MVEETIEDFPRGGAQILTPLETRKIKESAQKDVLFGNFEPEKKKKKKIPKKDTVVNTDEISKSKGFTVNHFSFKYLVKGILVLGYVKEIYKSDIVIGLPNSLSGYISISEFHSFLSQHTENNSDNDNDSDNENDGTEDKCVSVSDIFSIGQLVPVSVKNLYPSKTGYQKIELSILPEDVNISVTRNCIHSKMLIWGMISSDEDHGYLISIGKDNISGFLKKDHSKAGLFRVGMLKWFCVEKMNSNKKVINLSVEQETLSKAQVHDPKVHFNSLLPGQLVKMTVNEISEDAVCGKISGDFDAVIESLHLMQQEEPNENLIKKKVIGRIIHVNPKTKQLGVSLVPDVVAFSTNVISTEYKSGDIVKDCEVVKFESDYGLFMKMPNETFGVVHISRISDEHTEKVGKRHKTGTKHTCRVLGYSALDSAYTLTMKKSDLEKPFLRYEDLKGGMIISGEVITLEEFGCLVKITNHIRGLCPKVHLSDINLTHPERKFEEGKKLKFRVLYIKPESRKLILTHKKTLLKSKLPLLVSMDDVKGGEVVHGFVSKIKTFGLFVSFYNEIKALLPKSEINIPKDSSLPELYYVGQVVQCTVIAVNKDEGKLVVSLKEQDGSQPIKIPLKRGEVVDGIFKGVTENHSLTMSSNGSDSILPVHHFSDFIDLNEGWKSLSGSLKSDFTLTSLIVYGYHKKLKQNLISQKQVLLQDGCKIKCFQDLKIGLICAGVVSHIMSYGIFVDVSPDVTGLIPISLLADQYVKSPGDSFNIGQSLIVKVTEIDEEKRRFLMASKPSVLQSESEMDNPFNVKFTGIALLKTYLIQRKALHQHAVNCTDAAIRSLPSLPGEVIVAKIIKVDQDGVSLSYHNDAEDIDVDGFIHQSLRYGADIEMGKECQCYVFSIDLKNKLFLATMYEDAIATVIKRKRKEKKKKLKFPEEQKINALVVNVDREMAVLLLPDQGFSIAYMPARTHLNEISDITKRLKVNQNIFVKFMSKDDLGIIVSSVNEVDESKITVGSVLTAVVKGIKPTQLSVTMLNGKMHGRVHISNICDDFDEGKSLLAEFQPLQLIDVKIIAFRDMKTHNFLPITHPSLQKSLAELSLKPSVIASSDDISSMEKRELTDYKMEDTVCCYITSVTKKCVWVTVNPSVKGRIQTLHFSDDKKELKKLSSTIKPGFAYKAVVIGNDDEHNCLELSRIGDPSKLIVKESIVTGRILRMLTNGVLIELPDHKAGLANITELHDSFKEDPFEEFSVNQIVKCKIISVKKGEQVDLSLRQSRLTNTEPEGDFDRTIDGYDDLKEGDILRGYIKSCMKIGVFVSLSSNINGRVQIKNLSQYFVKNFMELFPVGKLVKAKILSIDPATNHIDLSLRGKDVGGPDLAPPPKRKSTEDVGEDEDADYSNVKRRKLYEEKIESDSDSDSDSGIEAAEEINDESDEEDVGEKPCLQLSTPFDWSAEAPADLEVDHANDSDEVTEEQENKIAAKKTKRQKRAAKKAEEEYLHKAELALLETKSQLESADDFDRILLGSPNSSLIWIQYMAFHLHSAEIEKARTTAEKALKTISFREEEEKFNLWVALLNLESMYGTSESLEKTFQRALKVNEPKKVYQKMVDLYIKSDKKEEAEKMYMVMVKKFRTSLKVWTGYGYFLMKTGQVDAARKLLQRSLKSLPQRKHIETIVKFALMEYKMGEPNRGATIFESILKNYPKRTDLWSIYIDMNIKQGDLEQVRNTFERATTLVINSKKMKFLFKRYLTFEEEYGSKTTVEAVRKKALEYVENKMVEDE